jgi:hypothetical protein
MPGGLVVRALHVDDVSELGRLMFAAYRGALDDHGETAEWHLQEAARTLRGVFGRVLWDASLVATEGGMPGCNLPGDRGEEPPVARLRLGFARVLGKGTRDGPHHP